MVSRSVRQRESLSIPSIAAAVVALTLAACSGPEPAPPPPLPEQPNQVTEGYHTTQTRDGVQQWELWGATAERFPGEGQPLRLHQVRMQFYRNGVRDATLTAATADVDEASHNVTARGNVRVVNPRGQVLESEVLHWDDRRQRIHTDEFVKLTEGDQILTGYGLETDPDLTDLTLRERVEGDLPTQDQHGEGLSR